MVTSSTDSKLAKAWRYHRDGRNAESIAEFQGLLKTTPKEVDVYYGLGLAQRADDQKQAAIDSFKEALQLAQDAYKALVAEETEGKTADHMLNITENDRLSMLQRMIEQRLTELGVTNKK